MLSKILSVLKDIGKAEDVNVRFARDVLAVLQSYRATGMTAIDATSNVAGVAVGLMISMGMNPQRIAKECENLANQIIKAKEAQSAD